MQWDPLTPNKFVLYQMCIGVLRPFWSETGKRALADVRTLAEVRILIFTVPNGNNNEIFTGRR